ncbi:MAG: hypothetical protein AAGG06_17135, partial [Pseudomonadota bacterium]
VRAGASVPTNSDNKRLYDQACAAESDTSFHRQCSQLSGLTGARSQGQRGGDQAGGGAKDPGSWEGDRNLTRKHFQALQVERARLCAGEARTLDEPSLPLPEPILGSCRGDWIIRGKPGQTMSDHYLIEIRCDNKLFAAFKKFLERKKLWRTYDFYFNHGDEKTAYGTYWSNLTATEKKFAGEAAKVVEIILLKELQKIAGIR